MSCSSAPYSAQAAGRCTRSSVAPIYTASARLSAVNVNTANSASAAGSLESAQELASTYARVVQTSRVIQAVASALHTTPAWAVQHVSGTPIPNSPFVRIDANASTPAVAITAANAALKALTPYVRKLTQPASGAPLLATVRAYALTLSRAESKLGHIKGQALGGTPSPGLQTQIDNATADVAEAQTRLSGAESAYTLQAENQPGVREAIATSSALIATSDRKQVAEDRHPIGTPGRRRGRRRGRDGARRVARPPNLTAEMAGRLSWLQTPGAVIAGVVCLAAASMALILETRNPIALGSDRHPNRAGSRVPVVDD